MNNKGSERRGRRMPKVCVHRVVENRYMLNPRLNNGKKKRTNMM